MEPTSSPHMPSSPHRTVAAISLSTIGLLMLATAASGASPGPGSGDVAASPCWADTPSVVGSIEHPTGVMPSPTSKRYGNDVAFVRTSGTNDSLYAPLAPFACSRHVSSLLVPTTPAGPTVELAMAAPASIKVSPSALAGPWSMTALEGAEGIAAGNGMFVAVGETGYPPQAAAWSSTDGRTWELARMTDASVGSGLTQVSATDDGFVALGAESGLYGAATERVEAWYSADGQTWERATVKKPARSRFQVVASGLADGPAGSLALGTFIGQDLAGQRLWRTRDDRTWQPAKLPKVSNPVWDAVVSYPKGYLLLGQSGRGMASNWRSVDGLTWKRVKDTPRLFDVAVGEGGTLAGIGYKHIYRSPKGLRAWEKALTRPTAWRVGGSNAFSFVEWDGSGFVVPGNDFSGCVPSTDECHTNPLLVSVCHLAVSTHDHADAEDLVMEPSDDVRERGLVARCR